MKKILLIGLSFLFIISCKSQDKENPKKLGEKNNTFYLDRITFKENKDTLLSGVKYVIGNINDKATLYNINDPEKILVKIGSCDIKFDYMQFWTNKSTNKFILLELEAESDDNKNKEIIENLKKSFKMVDLTDKEILKEDIRDPNTFLYHKSYLFKSSDVYVFMKSITFKDKKEKDRIFLNFYSYPYDSVLIETEQVSSQIINQ
ncbi:hypothetical protein [Chryseobacterium sp. M5A1_1a]